jgi:hypothetical protein
VAPGRTASGGPKNSGQPPAGAGRARAGECLRSAMGRFDLDLGVEVAGDRVCSGAQRPWPSWPVCRRGRLEAGVVGAVGELG